MSTIPSNAVDGLGDGFGDPCGHYCSHVGHRPVPSRRHFLRTGGRIVDRPTPSPHHHNPSESETSVVQVRDAWAIVPRDWVFEFFLWPPSLLLRP